MSTQGYSGIATSVLQERWPGYVSADRRLLKWGRLKVVVIEVVVDTEIDPTEESNAISWGNN